MSFSSLGLSPFIVDVVVRQGYDKPFPIQCEAIPAILEGRDIMAVAQTGTGKTASFTLPIVECLSRGGRVHSNHVRALILTPTRELAAQVGISVKKYSQGLPLRSVTVFGGVKINPQMMALRKGADILVATPGRLLDLYQQNAVRFQQLEVLVLDEADRMLDMGFIEEVQKILRLLPKTRQNLLFSATFSDDVRHFAKGLVQHPVEISVDPPCSPAPTVEQLVHPVDKNKKSALLVHLMKCGQWQQVLAFSKTKRGADRLVQYLKNKGYTATAIHSDKSQGARTKALADFKNGVVQVMVATDIAARGIDISELPHVVNVDLPITAEDYIHRIGRTGRAGACGHALSLVCAEESRQLFAIERLVKTVLTRQFVKGFEPEQPVPPSRLGPPKKPKKPKKKKNRQGEGK